MLLKPHLIIGNFANKIRWKIECHQCEALNVNVMQYPTMAVIPDSSTLSHLL